MTQEDKELLLKDLCARLLYGVKVKFKVNEVIEKKKKFIYNIDGEYSYITDGKSYLTLDIIKMLFNNYLDEIKPYLFPMSKMTEEQFKEYWELEHSGDMEHLSTPALDWLNKNHFDYRGLIEKGLAIDAKDKNIY